MKKGDLVRVKDDAVPMFHDSSCSHHDYTLVGGGELVVVVEPSVRWIGYAQVLHPMGVCYIRKQLLEVI